MLRMSHPMNVTPTVRVLRMSIPERSRFEKPTLSSVEPGRRMSRRRFLNLSFIFSPSNWRPLRSCASLSIALCLAVGSLYDDSQTPVPERLPSEHVLSLAIHRTFPLSLVHGLWR